MRPSFAAWSKENPNDAVFKPIALVDKMVAEGRTGRKSGRGFYDYTEPKGDEKQAIAAKQFVENS